MGTEGDDFRVEYPPLPSFVMVGMGFALAPTFTVHTGSGTMEVSVDVEIRGQREAHAVGVSVRHPSGVTSTDLRAVSIRELVARGVRDVLMRVEFSSEGAVTLSAAEPGEDVEVLVRTLVKYLGAERA